jgi:endonuclease/exonuclease/phosphatase family metal-dependent hydrolase
MRVVSWNIHGCVGADRRYDPERIARVLARLRPDLVLLQEVGEQTGPHNQVDQAQLLAGELGMICAVGITIEAGPFGYGLATLCRGPLLETGSYDLSIRGREPRACLRVVTVLGAARLTVLNVHLGLAFRERRRQLERLLREGGPLHRPPAPLLLAGDFNDWAPGRVTRLLGRRLVDEGAGRGRTFPSLFPAARLDRIYVGRGLRALAFEVVRSRQARFASDHLPILAELALFEAEVESFVDQPLRLGETG